MLKNMKQYSHFYPPPPQNNTPSISPTWKPTPLLLGDRHNTKNGTTGPNKSEKKKMKKVFALVVSYTVSPKELDILLIRYDV